MHRMGIEMLKYSGENVRRLVKAITKDGIGLGAVVTIGPFGILTPKLWVDFLNATPKNAHSMWPVYRGLMGYFQEFRNWVASQGFGCGPYASKIQPLSREGFLDKYPDMKKDTKALQDAMKEALDKRKTNVIKKILKDWDSEAVKAIAKGAIIPPLPFTLRIERVGPGQDDLTLDIPKVEPKERFWLSVAFGAMVQAWKDGTIPARRCANCDQFFIPYPRAPNQRFHSSSCKSTYHTRKRRLSNK